MIVSRSAVRGHKIAPRPVRVALAPRPPCLGGNDGCEHGDLLADQIFR